MALQQMTEDRKMYNAMQVSFTTDDWTVIVQVVEKHQTSESQNKGTIFKKYVLTDMEGTKFAAVTFNTHIAPLEKLLIPFKRYKIANARLKVAEPKYRLGEYGYEWILSIHNLIDPIHDEVPYTLPCSYAFNKFSELHRFAEHNEYVAIKALVIQSNAIYGSSNSKARDYILIDEEKIPMVLRLWEDFLDNEDFQVSAKLPEPTLIVGLTLRVTTYHGISLTTPKYNAYFMVNPPLPDAEHMMEWYKENSAEIAGLLRNKAYDDADILLRRPKNSDLSKIKDVTTKVQQFKTAWIAGKLELMPGQEKLWQSVCGNCKKYRTGKVNWNFMCTSCGKRTTIVPRGRMEVYLTDDSGTLAATVFSPIFEKLTEFSVAQLYEADVKGQSLLKEMETALYGIKVCCFVNFFASDKNYTILQLYKEDSIPTIEAIQMQIQDKDTVEESSKETSQFFSPTTKAVLKEISDSTELQTEPHTHSPLSKRTLMFGSIPTTIPAAATPEKNQSVSDPHKMDMAESPVKKMKNKDEDESKAK